MNDMKDQLVDLTANQADPHLFKATDVKVAQQGKHGDVPGSPNTLADFGDNLRHNEDGGMGDSGAGTPTGGDWGAAAKGKAFKASVNSGEGDMPSTAVKIGCSVDCTTGQVVPNVEKDCSA
jgi:hypothetical protein